MQLQSRFSLAPANCAEGLAEAAIFPLEVVKAPAPGRLARQASFL
jgi:hypothetical protein